MDTRSFPVVKYYAAKSGVNLHTACDYIKTKCALPEFVYDRHDSWEYGISQGEDFAVNVTKTERCDTISTWMQSAPNDVNFQIILSTTVGVPKNSFQELLRHALGSDVTLYEETEQGEPADARRPQR